MTLPKTVSTKLEVFYKDQSLHSPKIPAEEIATVIVMMLALHSFSTVFHQ